MEAPLRQIATNAGAEASVANNVRDGVAPVTTQVTIPMAICWKWVFWIQPITRSALQFASSVGALMITTEAMIADIPQDDNAGGMGGDMGGMGGMGGMM